MDIVMEKDLKHLLDDSERIHRDLKRLDQDFSAWAREREKQDIENIIKDLEKAEIDVSLMVTDCVCAGRHSGKNAAKVIFQDLHWTFVYLDALFNDLKRARSELQEAFIHPYLIDRLEIDCGRFKKTVDQIRTDLNG